MSLRLQIFLFCIWFFVMVFLLEKARKKVVDIKTLLPWLFFDIILIIITALPNQLKELACWIGIETPSNMLFFFGFIIVIGLLFSLVINVSKLQKTVKDLTQRIAILENQIEEDKKKEQNDL